MEKLETELVIIGCGTAGLAAGLTALQNGTKKVVLLEKRINYGGNSSMAGGMMFGAESRLQKKEGNVVYRDAIFKATIEFAHFDRINSRLVRALIDKSGETIDWLEGYGIQFELAPDKLHILKGKFKAAIMQYSLVMETLANKILEKGGRILLRTSAKKILRDEKGAISGVVAATRDGGYLDHKRSSGLRGRPSRSDIQAFLKSLWLLGVWHRGRLAYWRFFVTTLIRRPHHFPQAVELAIIGHHFRCVARLL